MPATSPAPAALPLVLRGIGFRTLLDADAVEVSSRLDVPELARWLGDVPCAFAERAERDRRGGSFTLVAERADGTPLGRVGVLPYRGLAGALQTSTFLHPSVWGTGLNALCKLVQWHLARNVLAHAQLVASIDAGNERSRAAMRKLYPHACSELVDEPWLPRQAERFELPGPPACSAQLTAAEARALARACAGHPALAGLRPAGAA